jgi:hypothetical protein
MRGAEKLCEWNGPPASPLLLEDEEAAIWNGPPASPLLLEKEEAATVGCRRFPISSVKFRIHSFIFEEEISSE